MSGVRAQESSARGVRSGARGLRGRPPRLLRRPKLSRPPRLPLRLHPLALRRRGLLRVLLVDGPVPHRRLLFRVVGRGASARLAGKGARWTVRVGKEGTDLHVSAKDGHPVRKDVLPRYRVL